MKKNNIIVITTILFIFLISVAWSAFSQNLTITGEASIVPDTTPPTCGEWKLRPASLTYQEATNQNAFINPATNNTWTQDSLILSVDCSDDTSCIADHYDVKTYNTTIKTESAALSQVIEDVVEHSTTCTLPVGGSNPYVDKDAPEIDTLTITPLDGEFKVSLELKDGSDDAVFQNIDGAYYTYEGKSFIGTGVNNVIISEDATTQAQYSTANGTDNGDGTYTFIDHPAADAAAAYCSGCRLLTHEEANSWCGIDYTEHLKCLGKYEGTATNWWLADPKASDVAWRISSSSYINYDYVTYNRSVRPAVSISSSATMSGSGTQADPYVITTPQSGIVSTQFYYKKCSDNNWTALAKDTFNATDSKSYTDWYIPSNGTSSTSCLASSWGTYHFKVDVEDAVGNTKTYYNTGTSGVTDNVNNMTQFALLPPDAEHITYSNNSTNCTNLACAYDELSYMYGLPSPFLAFQNIDGAYYTYEGKSFIGTGVNNVIISERNISSAKYASTYAKECSNGSTPTLDQCPSGTTPVFTDNPAADAASAYCSGCRLMTKDEAVAWDSAAGTGASTKRKENRYNTRWWLADAYGTHYAWYVDDDGSISNSLPITNSFGVRPAVSILNTATMSGSGTSSSPYVIQ